MVKPIALLPYMDIISISVKQISQQTKGENMNTNKSLKVRIALLIAVVAMALNACNVKQSCQQTACGIMSNGETRQAIMEVLDPNGDNLIH